MNKVEKLRTIAESFQASKFEPVGLSRNCHFQTIVGSGALGTKIFGPPIRNFNVTLERINTLDGDFFDVEYTDGFEKDDKSVIILHGLESNTKGTLVTNFTKAFLNKGFSCCLVSFRGCSGEDNRTVGAYHVGFTTDINQLINILHERHPKKHMYLCGFSLGGNVSLKYLGELCETAEGKGLYGAAVTCVPFDPTSSQAKLDVGFNRAVYSMSFLETLKAKAEAEYSRFPGYFDLNEIRACNTIGAFDEAYIARIYGFRDKYHYYDSSSSKKWLSRIRVPVVAINALDDPFMDAQSYPTPERDVGDIAPVRLIYTTHGGHCGFYTTQTYMNSTSTNNSDADRVPNYGYIAEELARAIQHIHTNTLALK